MRFASLGSGSRGNATLIECGQTRILLDCGFGLRDLRARLARLGREMQDLSAILITHEHSDHVAGAFRLAAQAGIALYMTHGTQAALSRRHDPQGAIELHLIDSHEAFAIDDLQVEPFPVPHDAREPVQFVFTQGRHRLGIATDLGSSTAHVVDMLSGCDALVLECNHDADLLQQGTYPAHLKRRIRSDYGHLDNEAAASLLARLDRRKLQHLVAAHLSEQNNTPERARQAFAGVLGCAPEWIGVADQDIGFDWRELS